jgi:hypothetical protein
MDASQVRVRARIPWRELAGAFARAHGIDVTVGRCQQKAQVPVRAGVRRIARERRFREAYCLLARAPVDRGLKLRQESARVQNLYSARTSTARGAPKKLS